MAENTSQSGAGLEGRVGVGIISLEHFIALNDELAALVRAGLPLERGLRDVGRDIPGALGNTVELLAKHMSQGASLPQAIAAERHCFPEIYRAVVEAGLRAGRLSIALEGLAGFARNYAEMRRAIGMALIYPLIVLSFAYGLFVFFVLEIMPRFLAAYSHFRLNAPASLAMFVGLKETFPFWGPVIPVLLLLAGVWWKRSARVMWLQPIWGRRTLGWLPRVGGIMTHSRSACFAELLGLLIENEVPLHESITLAGEASADRAMIAGAREIAAAMGRGESGLASAAGATVFPPMLRWLMATGLERGMLAKALRHAAETYRELALYQASLVRQLLPLVLLLALGGTAAFLYSLSVFVPFTTLLYDLSRF